MKKYPVHFTKDELTLLKKAVIYSSANTIPSPENGELFDSILKKLRSSLNQFKSIN